MHAIQDSLTWLLVNKLHVTTLGLAVGLWARVLAVMHNVDLHWPLLRSLARLADSRTHSLTESLIHLLHETSSNENAFRIFLVLCEENDRLPVDSPVKCQ